MTLKPKDYQIEWRGKITRDLGWTTLLACSAADAKSQFQSHYPMREIIAVKQIQLMPDRSEPTQPQETP